jgi:antitoxin component of MazEF toxin-antitoxin module
MRQNSGKRLAKALSQTQFYGMVKTITKVGNSQGIIFDAALLELAHLRAGDQVNVTVHEGGTITLTPLRPKPSPQEVSRAVKATLKNYARTMKRLA